MKTIRLLLESDSHENSLAGTNKALVFIVGSGARTVGNST
jgi:hypothetical protein